MTIFPGPLRGDLTILPSKSQLHRLLICAALADGETSVRSAPTQAEDVAATIACLTALGAKIQQTEGGFRVAPIDRANLPRHAILPCRESGSTFRFMLPLVCALGVSGEFHMAGRLPERPIAPLDSELTRHGVRLTRPKSDVLCAKGLLQPGDFRLPGKISSQYITGLLLALPLLTGDSALTIEGPVESEGYIHMTLEACKTFGQTPVIEGSRYVCKGGLPSSAPYQTPGTVSAEGDWSNAAFWLCAGAMPGGNVTVHGLSKNSRQGDREIIHILEQMGARITWAGEAVAAAEGRRRAVEIDAAGVPDLIPVLSAVAAVGEGRTVIRNAARLRIKESDRLASTAQTLNALGARVTEEAEGLIIDSVPRLTGGTVDAWGDHRIAMMAAVAGTAAGGPVTITGAQAVRKSYPQFFDDLAALGGNLVIEEA